MQETINSTCPHINTNPKSTKKATQIIISLIKSIYSFCRKIIITLWILLTFVLFLSVALYSDGKEINFQIQDAQNKHDSILPINIAEKNRYSSSYSDAADKNDNCINAETMCSILITSNPNEALAKIAATLPPKSSQEYRIHVSIEEE